MASTIVGVDFGANAVRGVEVRLGRNRSTVIRSAEEPIPAGAVRGGDVLERGNVAAALRRLWSRGRFGSKDVILGVGGPKVFARDISLPDASAERVRESLPFLVQDQLPMPANEALLDFYSITRDPSPEGPVLNGLLVAAEREMVLQNVETVLSAGLRPVRVDLIPFALSRALAPTGPATVLISVGAWTTHVVIVEGGIPLFVRMISFGGEDLTNGISSRLAIPASQAEGLKRQFGLVRGTAREEHRSIVEAVYAASWDFISGIRDTLDFYASGKRAVTPSRIVLSGGSSALPGLAPALTELTSLPVGTVDPFAGSDLASLVRRMPRESHDLMTTAYGLALGGAA